MVVTLTGNNIFLLKGELDRLVGEFLREHGDLALERVEAEETAPERIVEAVQSVSFLAARKMVVIKNLSANKAVGEAVEQILDAAGDTTDLIIYDPNIDKRTVLFKILKKRTELRDYKELDERELAQWLVETAQQEGASLSSGDASYLVNRVGTDQMLLHQELNKLITYNSQISRQSIDELTEPSPQSRIFDLLDAAFGGRIERALELYEDQRAQKVEPQQIMAMITWQLHILAVVKTAGNRNADQIAKDAKLNPFVVRKTQNILSKLSLDDVKRLISYLLEIDILSKTTSLDLDEALKTYITIELAS